MGGDGGGFKAYNDHEWATGHSAKTNPWVRSKGKLGSDAAKKVALEVAAHENRLAPSRIWLPTAHQEDCAFAPAACFEGARDGYVFKLGVRGLGYYADEGKWVDTRLLADAAPGAVPGLLGPQAHRPCVFFDLSAGGRPLGRIVFRLWADVAPRACADFQQLAVGGLGTSRNTAAPQRLHYRGTRVDRIVRGVALYGGAIDGADESLQLEPAAELTQKEAGARNVRHTHAGLLGTDSPCGPLERTSRFVLTLAAAPQLDGLHLVFGEVASGLGLLLELERVPTDGAGVPSGAGVRLTDCGLVAESGLGGAPAAASAHADGRACPSPLDEAGARALSEQTTRRVGTAMSEGLARAAVSTAGLMPSKRALADDAPSTPGMETAKRGSVAKASAVAARWQAPLDEPSDEESSSQASG